jgi:hypothetical protein
MFGFMQKNVNAMDILIEDAKVTLQTWGSLDPSFMLVNSKLTFQMTMTPEKTNFITQGYDGIKRLRVGPFLDSYRGLNIIHSRQYSLETGAPPRDLLRRRVRVAEYYRIPWSDDFLGQALVVHGGGGGGGGGAGGAHLRHNAENAMFGSQILVDLYDESKDTFFTITWQELLLHAALDEEDRCAMLESLQGQNRRNEDALLPDIAGQPLPRILERTNYRVSMNMANVEERSVLLLVDTPLPQQLSAVQAWEFRTFNRLSGLFPVSTNGRDSPYLHAFRFELPAIERDNMTVSLNGTGVVPIAANQRHGGPGPNWRQGVNPAIRKCLFTQLMLGAGAQQADGAHVWQDFVDCTGMRPNLHVGRMVYTFAKPQAPRFVHIAAQVFSQVVVTKQLTKCLLQMIHKPGVRDDQMGGNAQWTAEDITLLHEATQVLGIRGWNSYFGVERSLLVYMAAAVLHPQQSMRSKFKEHLLAQKVNLEKLGEHLVAFIKFFISSLPMANQQYKQPRTFHPDQPTSFTGHIFNCLEQGRNVEKIFERFAATDQMREQSTVPNAWPVVYLGPLKDKGICRNAYASVPANTPSHLQDFLLPRNWAEGDIDREVRAADFTGPNPDQTDAAYRRQYPGLRGFVYPSKEKMRQEDYLAITKSINAQDCLVAFCQIMVKRFFFDQPQKFVETTMDGNGNVHEERVNEQVVPDGMQVRPDDLSRVALTSNDYPVHKCGSELMEEHERAKWEIVIVRPNIEHNMLGAILGRSVFGMQFFVAFVQC